MASKYEVMDNIKTAKEDITKTVDQISNLVNKKIDIEEKVKENPLQAIAIAILIGFLLAISTKAAGIFGIFRILGSTATKTAFAGFIAKKVLGFIIKRVTK